MKATALSFADIGREATITTPKGQVIKGVLDGMRIDREPVCGMVIGDACAYDISITVTIPPFGTINIPLDSTVQIDGKA